MGLGSVDGFALKKLAAVGAEILETGELLVARAGEAGAVLARQVVEVVVNDEAAEGNPATDKFQTGDRGESGLGGILDREEEEVHAADSEGDVHLQIIAIRDGMQFFLRMKFRELLLGEILEHVVKKRCDNLAAESAHASDLRHALGELQHGRIERLRGAFQLDVAIHLSEAVLGEDLLKNPELVWRIQLVVVGEPHERHSMVADAHLAIFSLFEIQVDHVAILMEERHKELGDAGPLFLHAQVVVELGSQGFECVHGMFLKSICWSEG